MGISWIHDTLLRLTVNLMIDLTETNVFTVGDDYMANFEFLTEPRFIMYAFAPVYH
jgi:hypothetical protein